MARRFLRSETKRSARFLVANIVEDYRMLEVARDEAGELIQSGRFFTDEYEVLRNFVEENLLHTSFD